MLAIDSCIDESSTFLYLLFRPSSFTKLIEKTSYIGMFNRDENSGNLEFVGNVTIHYGEEKASSDLLYFPQDNQHLYLLSNIIRIYNRDEFGSLVFNDTFTLHEGGVSYYVHFAASPDGSVIYICLGEYDIAIFVLSRDPISGNLELLRTYNKNVHKAISGIISLIVSSCGSFLYTSSDFGLTVWSVDPIDSSLSFVELLASTNFSPFSQMVFSSDGRFMTGIIHRTYFGLSFNTYHMNTTSGTLEFYQAVDTNGQPGLESIHSPDFHSFYAILRDRIYMFRRNESDGMYYDSSIMFLPEQTISSIRTSSFSKDGSDFYFFENNFVYHWKRLLNCPSINGYYCTEPTSKALPCPPGTFCPLNATNPQSCNTGMFCPGGTSTGLPCEDGLTTLFEEQSECAVRCRYCIGGGVCSDGYVGAICSSCDFNYYSSGNLCLKCSIASWPAIVLFSCCIVVAFISFFFLHSMKSVVGRLVSNFLQIAAISTFITVDWPSFMPFVMDYFIRIGFIFDFFHPECQFSWNVYHKAIGSILFLLLIVVLFALIAFWYEKRAAKFLSKMDINSSDIVFLTRKSAFFKYLVMLAITLSYPYQISTLLKIFSCIETRNGDFLISDSNILCYDSLHIAMMIFAFIFLVFIGIGIPLIIFLLFRSLRRKYGNLRDNEFVRKKYSAFFEDFCNEMPWFDSVIMIRKLFMLLTIFVIPYSYLQALFFFFYSVIYGVVVFRYPPYNWSKFVFVLFGKRFEFSNSMEVLSSITLAFSHVLAFFMWVFPQTSFSLGVASFILFFIIFLAFFRPFFGSKKVQRAKRDSIIMDPISDDNTFSIDYMRMLSDLDSSHDHRKEILDKQQYEDLVSTCNGFEIHLNKAFDYLNNVIAASKTKYDSKEELKYIEEQERLSKLKKHASSPYEIQELLNLVNQLNLVRQSQIDAFAYLTNRFDGAVQLKLNQAFEFDSISNHAPRDQEEVDELLEKLKFIRDKLKKLCAQEDDIIVSLIDERKCLECVIFNNLEYVDELIQLRDMIDKKDIDLETEMNKWRQVCKKREQCSLVLQSTFDRVIQGFSPPESLDQCVIDLISADDELHSNFLIILRFLVFAFGSSHENKRTKYITAVFAELIDSINNSKLPLNSHVFSDLIRVKVFLKSLPTEKERRSIFKKLCTFYRSELVTFDSGHARIWSILEAFKGIPKSFLG